MPSYSPGWAPNVTGKWPEVTRDEDGRVEEMKVDMVCSFCGETFRYTCTSGAPHAHIQKFALSHVHRDPMRAGPQR